MNTMQVFSPISQAKESNNKTASLTDSEKEIINICRKIRLCAVNV